MSLFLRKALISLHNPNFSSLRLRLFSVSITEEDGEKRNSFVVSYLKKSLGFSPEIASSISKHVKFDSPDKPDKAIALFKSFGFTKTQISKLVKGLPEVLVSDTDKTVLPKLEFLKSKGVSDPEIAKTLSNFPSFLTSSLADQIVPSFDGLGEFFRSEKRTINALKRYPHILCRLNCIAANASVLRGHGVSDSNIALWLERYPRSFVSSLDRFREAAREIAEMGFVPSKANFAHAVRVSLSLSKATWDGKIRMLRRRGFSREEVSKVFRSFPNSMTCSENNISETVDFFVAEMGWSSPCSHISMYPSVLGLSLKKRIIPRCSVYRALLEKGLVKEKKVNLKLLLMATEEKFLDKYVRRYENHASELLKLYREKLL